MNQSLILGKISATLLVMATMIISGCSASTPPPDLRAGVPTAPVAVIPWANIKLIRTISTEGSSIAVGTDNQTLARGSYGKVEIWDLITGELQHTISTKYTTNNGKLRHEEDAALSVLISRDGRLLVSKLNENAVMVHEIKTGNLIRLLIAPPRTQFTSIAISPDSQTLISGDQHGTLKFWNLSSGELLHSVEEYSSSINSIDVSSNGQNFVSSAFENEIKLRNLKTFELISIYKWSVISSGKTSHIGDDGKAEYGVWSVQGGSADSVAISSNNQLLAAGGDGGIVAWNLSTKERLFTLRHINNDPEEIIDSVIISPDNQTLVSTSHGVSNDPNSIKGTMTRKIMAIWNLRTRMRLQTFIRVSKEVKTNVAFSPNGEFLVSDDTKKIEVYRTSP